MPEAKAPPTVLAVLADTGRIMWPLPATKKTDEGATSHRLFHYASWYIASRGYEFAHEVAQEIWTMIQGASSVIHGDVVPSGLELSDPDLSVDFKTKIAEAELGMFIDLMISASPGTKAGHLTIVQDSAFASARSRFCPIWLIC